MSFVARSTRSLSSERRLWASSALAFFSPTASTRAPGRKSSGRGERLARDRHQLRERLVVVDGELRELLAVQIHARLREAGHERAVRHLVGARGGAYANDPQAAEVALLLSPTAVGGYQRLIDRLLGGAIELAFGGAETLRELQHLAAPVATVGTSFYSRHLSKISERASSRSLLIRSTEAAAK